MEHEETHHSPYNFARDGFLYLISYFMLIIWSMALNFLAKALVNKVLHDSADVSGFLSSEFIVGLLPALLIAFPVFLWINNYSNKLLGHGKMRHDTGVRRWLIYLTMVVVIITIIAQLVFLLMSYLDGSAGARFLVHTLITLVIAAGILWYQWWQLKFFDGHEGKKLGADFKTLEWVTVIVVVGSLVLGFMTVGSPTQRRAEKLDDIRLQRISQIRNGVDTFYGATDMYMTEAAKPVPATSRGNLRLPVDLDELRHDARVYLTEDQLVDPVTNKRFEYRALETKKYEVCGEFATEYKVAIGGSKYYYPGKLDDYLHPKGHYCFQFAVSEGKF